MLPHRKVASQASGSSPSRGGSIRRHRDRFVKCQEQRCLQRS